MGTWQEAAGREYVDTVAVDVRMTTAMISEGAALLEAASATDQMRQTMGDN